MAGWTEGYLDVKVDADGKLEMPPDKLVPRALNEWRIRATLTMFPKAPQGQTRERSLGVPKDMRGDMVERRRPSPKGSTPSMGKSKGGTSKGKKDWVGAKLPKDQLRKDS